MSTSCRLASFLTFGALLLLALTGCNKPEGQEANLIFYPPPPDIPRLQFLVSFSSAEHWIERRSSFRDFVTGASGEERGDIKNPYGMAISNGKLYICDLGSKLVHVIDMANKAYDVLGAPGQVKNPVNITIDSDGTKYVCDTNKRRVVVFDANDKFVRDIGDPSSCVPIDLAIWKDKLFVVDIKGAEVEVWSRDGSLLSTISSKGRGPTQLRMPTNLEIGPNGHVYVVDTELTIVKEFDQAGKFIRTYGAPGDRPGYFARPKGIAIDPEGRIYVADSQWEVVQVFAPDGQLLLYFGGATPGPEGMGLPAGLIIDKTSLEVFRSLIDKEFKAEYLLLVANQFGVNKIAVYAYGVGPKPPAPAPKPDQEPSPSESDPKKPPSSEPDRSSTAPKPGQGPPSSDN